MSFNFEGLLMGLATFIIIGLFHPLVIKGEYYLGAKVSKILFALLGVITAVASLLVESFIASTLLGIIAFSSFWGIKEVAEQEERVARGWFPKNPRRD
ncbi:MAG: DUF4491 family protein [Duncaniella sp.]|nr:DUF4491 family protein [Duncaniella sp.]